MYRLNIVTPGGQLSWLMFEVAKALQITPTQHKLAVERYEAVGRWIERHAPELMISIYPQGSMALQTTVKPRGCEEYDLDLVLEVTHFWSGDPMVLYQWARDTLTRNATYKKILEPKKRCLRLNYVGEFHMDVLPATPDGARAVPGAIWVPDRELRQWTPSNPYGFRSWFERQCEEQIILTKRAHAEPVPDNDPAHLKAILQQVVQLIKRQRDQWFGDDEDAPRSVVLTTLAGHAYQGEGDLYGSLLGVLDRIASSTRQVPDQVLQVKNPTNNAELFSESWVAKPQSYEAFARWLAAFRDRVARLPHLSGMELDTELDQLFGEKVMGAARVEFGKRLQAEREAKRLRYSGGALTTVSGAGVAIPSHNFYGGDEK